MRAGRRGRRTGRSPRARARGRAPPCGDGRCRTRRGPRRPARPTRLRSCGRMPTACAGRGVVPPPPALDEQPSSPAAAARRRAHGPPRRRRPPPGEGDQLRRPSIAFRGAGGARRPTPGNASHHRSMGAVASKAKPPNQGAGGSGPSASTQDGGGADGIEQRAVARSPQRGGHPGARPGPGAVGPGECPGLRQAGSGRDPGGDADDLHATWGDSLHELTHRALDADAVEVLRPAGYPCTRKFKKP